MNEKSITTAGVILIFLSLNVLMSGCIEDIKFVKEGDNVKINIIEDNITRTLVIENISSYGRNYPFEKDIIGMKVGEKKNIAYEEIVSVKLNHEPKANTTYNFVGQTIYVFDVNDTHFSFAWHPLAGETLKFYVTIKNISKKKPVAEVLVAMECLAKYNISADTVGFLYSDNCPHCIRMKPWIQEMEKQGYKFLWINVAEAEKMKIARECLANILNFGRGVPQFACPSNAQWKLGAFRSKDEMKDFADICKKSAELKNKTKETIVEYGDFVEVEYIGRLTNGTIFDKGKVNFVVGEGKMIKGFEKGVIGMKMGESKELIIKPEEAYGNRESRSRIIEDVHITTFKLRFNETPIKGKKYINLDVSPWPLKVIDIKTITKNITVEILETGNFSYSCLEKYGIDKNAVIFYYTDWCPYCQRMKPLIKNLTAQGYKFFWVEAEKEKDKIKILIECASNVINFAEGFPQFGCPANGKTHIGAFRNIEDMKEFASECNKSA